MTTDRHIRVALLGHGVVGSAVAKLLVSQGPDLAARIGRPVELAGVGGPGDDDPEARSEP